MDSIFLNKARGHFQINDFLCNYSFIINIEEIDLFPVDVVEIEYNEFVNRKYYINSENERLELTQELIDICLYFIGRQSAYSSLYQIAGNTITLEDAISAKKLQIRANLGALLYSPIDFEDKTFWASDTAQKNIVGKISLISNPSDSIYWLDTLNQTVVFTLEQFKQLGRAIETRSSSLYFQEATKNNQLNNILISFNNSEITFQESLDLVSEIDINFTV
jgi:hypothetical protein